MERAVFDRMAELDEQHWWYVARRRILAQLIARKVAPPENARLLEIGCGTGHNLVMLGAFGRVDALEIDAEARAIASKRIGRPVGEARLPALEGVADGTYDLALLLDVLEHVEEDQASLEAVAAKLAPGGRLLITVPANPWMWSAHDEAHHHFRRYTRAGLTSVAQKAGFEVLHSYFFNSLLFPVVAAARIAGKLAGSNASDDAMPSPAMNTVLRTVFNFERHLIGRVSMPFGVSIAMILAARGDHLPIR